MNAWPKPKDPTALFSRTLMIIGPPPKNGWRRVRDLNGKVLNMYPNTAKTRSWLTKVTSTMAWEIKLQYPESRYGITLVQHWKNLFMEWLCDEEDTSVSNANSGGLCPYTRVRLGVQRPFRGSSRDQGLQGSGGSEGKVSGEEGRVREQEGGL